MQKRGEGGRVCNWSSLSNGKKKKRGEEGREIYHGSDKLPFVIHDEIRYSVSDAYIYICNQPRAHHCLSIFSFFFPFIFDSSNECTKNYWHAIRERDNKRDERGIVLYIYIYIYLFNFILFTIPFNQPIHSLPLL